MREERPEGTCKSWVFDGLSTRHGPIWIGIQVHAQLLQLALKINERLAGPKLGHRRLQQGRRVLSMQCTLPCHSLLVARKLFGRFTLFVQSPVFQIGIGIWKVEVLTLLLVPVVCCVVLVGAFVDIAHTVVEEPVSEDYLPLALDNLAVERPEAASALLAIPSAWGFLLFPELGKVLRQHDAK